MRKRGLREGTILNHLLEGELMGCCNNHLLEREWAAITISCIRSL